MSSCHSWLAYKSRGGRRCPKRPTVFFLAIICIVSYLQIALTQENVPKALIMALLITTPVFVVYGSRVGERLMIGSVTNANEDDANG